MHWIPWVVDHVRIDVGDAVQDQVREALPGQPDAPPRQPFQGPVGPHVYDRVRSEVVPKPSVECEVLVRHGDHGIVVDGLHLVRPGPERLEPDVDVPVHDPGDDEPPVLDGHLPGCLPPALLHCLPVELRQTPVFGQVLVHGYHVCGLLADPRLRRPFQVVGDVVEDLVYELPRGRRHVVHRVSEVAVPLQHVPDALDGIEASRPSDPSGIRSGLVHQDRDPPVLPGGACELLPFPDGRRQVDDPVREGRVYLRGAAALLVARDRHGYDLTVDLRPDDVHREIRLRQALGLLLVVGEMRCDGHGLEDRDVRQRVEVVLLVGGVNPVAVAGVVQLGERSGQDQRVYPPSGPVHEVLLHDGDRTLLPGRAGCGYGEEHGDDVHPLPLDLADELVDMPQIVVDPQIRGDHQPHGGLGRVQVLQILLQGHIPGEIGMVHAVRRMLDDPRQLPLAREHPVEPEDDRPVVLGAPAPHVLAETHVLLIVPFEQIAVDQRDVEVAGIYGDVALALLQHPLPLLEAPHPGGIGHDPDHDEVRLLRPQNEFVVCQRVLVDLAVVGAEQVQIPSVLPADLFGRCAEGG